MPASHLDLALAVRVSTAEVAPSIAAVAENVDDRDQVLALALEALVLGDPHLDVEVAGGAAGLAGVAGAADPDPLAVLDPGRDLDLLGLAPAVAAAAARTRSQGVSAILPSPPQRRRRPRGPSGRTAVRVTWRSWPAPPQRSQVRIGVPGSAPLPWQCSQAPTASKLTSR